MACVLLVCLGFVVTAICAAGEEAEVLGFTCSANTSCPGEVVTCQCHVRRHGSGSQAMLLGANQLKPQFLSHEHMVGDTVQLGDIATAVLVFMNQSDLISELRVPLNQSVNMNLSCAPDLRGIGEVHRTLNIANPPSGIVNLTVLDVCHGKATILVHPLVQDTSDNVKYWSKIVFNQSGKQHMFFLNGTNQLQFDVIPGARYALHGTLVNCVGSSSETLLMFNTSNYTSNSSFVVDETSSSHTCLLFDAPCESSSPVLVNYTNNITGSIRSWTTKNRSLCVNVKSCGLWNVSFRGSLSTSSYNFSAVRFTELELMDNVSSCTLVGNWNEEDCIDPTWVSAWYNNTILPDSIVKRTRRSIAVKYSNLRENISIIVRAPDGTTYMYSHQINDGCPSGADYALGSSLLIIIISSLSLVGLLT